MPTIYAGGRLFARISENHLEGSDASQGIETLSSGDSPLLAGAGLARGASEWLPAPANILSYAFFTPTES